ncbi:MAG: site-2 protease family protein [Alphaproteobacteria bacterium]|nr:site-2 protease family protein [Alphaproteobacteria bacterium]
MFLATLVCVFFTYGWFWSNGRPLGDPETTRQSALFAAGLMSILLAHELGHYVVARRHGFALSLPYFIPFPFAFGTFGAIIRLRSLPRSRTGLLEMGAAGPIAGAVVAIIVMAIGLPDTLPPQSIDPAAGLMDTEIPGVLLTVLHAIDRVLSWGPIGDLLAWFATPVPEGHVPVAIFNNPPIMDLLGTLILGAPPGRFDTLSPLALAGWVGCLLTAINLVPIGQLDGGHVLTAVAPKVASRLSRVLLVVVLIGGSMLWLGWAFWAVLLWRLGAWRNLDVPEHPPLTPRARTIAGVVLVLFALTFMPAPVEMDSMPAAPAEAATPGAGPAPAEPAP